MPAPTPTSRASRKVKDPLVTTSFGCTYTCPLEPLRARQSCSQCWGRGRGRTPRPERFLALLRHDRVEAQTGCAQMDPTSSPPPLASAVVAGPHCSFCPLQPVFLAVPGIIDSQISANCPSPGLTCMHVWPDSSLLAPDRLGRFICPKIAGLGSSRSQVEMASRPSFNLGRLFLSFTPQH